MNKREKILASTVGAFVLGWAMLNLVYDPMMTAFDAVKQESQELEQQLIQAHALVDSESTILRRWAGYEKSGLSRTRDFADVEASSSLLAWAERAGFDPKEVILTNDKTKIDQEQFFAQLSYTLSAQGSLKQIYQMLWSIRQSPFPLRLEKFVISIRNDSSESLQFTMTVSTLFTPKGKAS